MPDFTPGKWEYDEFSGVICSKGTKAVIAKVKDACAGGCFGVTAEGITNARLIAAAPEMYQWLSGLLCYVYEANALTTNSGAKKETAEDIAQVEALLARIDGREANHD